MRNGERLIPVKRFPYQNFRRVPNCVPTTLVAVQRVRAVEVVTIEGVHQVDAIGLIGYLLRRFSGM
ncbi:hypothetical protein [Neorhodopirellula lusitana]|uniref:hypothetical protein n=1 Tax=Neorhodopirellula lusitana TaxID=445327 RepID=UPI0024B731D6|nr:hypothetical protein [Neorhodopirellula lusitana]